MTSMYHVDIVFCVDVSASMSFALEYIKEFIGKHHRSLWKSYDASAGNASFVRVRVVTFRDLSEDSQGLSASPFFVVEPDHESHLLRKVLDGMSAYGGGDEPESALEALGVAINSRWTHQGDKQRCLIVLFTDSSAHRLERRVGLVPEEFQNQVPASLDELKSRWGESSSGVKTEKLQVSQRQQRLLLFAPKAYPWDIISDDWPNVILIPFDDLVGGPPFWEMM